MKDFTFEYTDVKFTLKLMGLSFLVFALLLISMVVTVKILGVIGALMLAFGIPLLLFFSNKSKIKREGSAIIYDTYAEFQLSDASTNITYEDIKTYQIEHYNGTSLAIKFKNGKDFKLQANSNFCNALLFDKFCRAFEATLQQFKADTNVELVRKKSMFEQIWMLPLLLLLTVGIIGVVVFALLKGKKIPGSLFGSTAVVISLWVGYFTARGRRQEQGN